MKLELYQNTSDTKRIGKSLALVETLDGIYLKEGTDLLHPVFTFHKFQDANNNWIWKNFNYAKLRWSGFQGADEDSELKRCYFVDKFIMTPGGIIEIHCSIDVRETWKDYILGMNYLVSRQEYVYNKCIPDERRTVPLNRSLQSVKVGTVGDGGDGTIVLTVTGGV